jgi:drug/metabolite transporter (DMT)-like permease
MFKRKIISGSETLLIIAAIIWGFGFVAQKEGMNHIGPCFFNTFRFFIGAFFILLISLIKDLNFIKKITLKDLLKGSAIGFVLFLAISFQQTGLIYTKTANGGFITGLYVIIVPALGFLMWRTKTGLYSVLGSILAIIGLYFLSFKNNYKTNYGDLLILISTFFWAYHVLLIDKFIKKMLPLKIAFLQFFSCAIFSLIAGFFNETISLNMIESASFSILYVGLFSSGIAFTFQVLGQKKVSPTNTAIILGLECVFAAVGGWIVLGEALSIRAIFGCIIMLCGMIVSQIKKS